MNDCILTFSTHTSAVKASRYLKRSGLAVLTVSVDPSVTAKGCGWGVSFNCSLTDRIKKELDGKGMSYGEVLSGGI